MATSSVSGRVYAVDSGEGIGGVPVSNGDAIVQTASDGRYTLAIDPQQDRYVFITVPAGYRPRERFYALLDDSPTQAACDFPLLAAPERARTTFRLAHLSDTHVVIDGSGPVSQEMLARDLHDLVQTAAPDLAIITGDLTNMGTVEELEGYRTAVESAGIPVVSVFGGHDGNIERRSSSADTVCTRNFEATLGPTYYSFDWGGYHFVVYATEDHYFSAAGRARKERWLQADLARQPSGRASVLMLHTAPDADLLARFSRLGGALVLHGHWHSSRVFTAGDTLVASAPSFCFGGIDTRPRGCRLISFSPQGVETALHAQSRSAKSARKPNPATDAPNPQPPSRIAIGAETHSLAWTRALGSPLHRAAPVAFRDNVLVSLHSERHPGRDGVLCVDSHSGEERWQYATAAAVKHSCAVVTSSRDAAGAGGAALCAALTVTGELHLIDVATGERAWSAALPSHPHRWVCSAPAHNGEVIVAGSKAGYGAYALADGAQRWYAAPSDGDEWPLYIHPQVYRDELCIVLVQRRGILALGMADGGIVWERDLPVEYYCASPVLAGDLVVVSSASPHTGASLTGGRAGDLAVLAARTGNVVNHFANALPGYATGVAVQDGRIYTATAAGSAHCHDLHSGAELWQFQCGDDLLDMTPYRRKIRSLLAAPVPRGEHVLVPSCDGHLYVLESATGACADRVNFGAPLTASPCVTPDGFALGTYAGSLFSYQANR